jgi:hypothetical protein
MLLAMRTDRTRAFIVRILLVAIPAAILLALLASGPKAAPTIDGPESPCRAEYQAALAAAEAEYDACMAACDPAPYSPDCVGACLLAWGEAKDLAEGDLLACEFWWAQQHSPSATLDLREFGLLLP